MFPHSDLSDEELLKRIHDRPAQVQQSLKAEWDRRQSLKAEKQMSSVQEEVRKVRDELFNVKDQLKILGRSHRLHLWILVVAILTGAMALIAALDVVMRWLPA